MITRFSRLAALIAALVASTACACTPDTGTTTNEVAALCGPADAEHIATGELGTQSEWLYGDVVVGFIDGCVAYVLN